MARLTRALLLTLLFAGCSCGKSPDPVLELTGGDARVTVELAIGPEARARGLGGRKRLPDGVGLLMADGFKRRMDLLNLADSLDVSTAFLRDDWTIAGIVEMDAESASIPDHLRQSYRAPEPVRYVLQVAAGWFERKGLSVGDKLAPSKALLDRLPEPMVATLWVGDQQITAELALTEDTRRDGLMWRESLPENHGMLFVEPGEPRGLKYWMGNCKMPIAIAFIRADMTIANSEWMDVEPEGRAEQDHRRYASKGPVKYALEMSGVKGDWFAKRGFTEGTKIRFSAELERLLEHVR